MEENLEHQKFVVLEEDEVVELDKKTHEYLGLRGNDFEYLYLINAQLITAIIRRVDIRDTGIKDKLFYDGLECEVLKPGAQNWQKGKIRIELTVGFCPDEPEEAEEIESSQTENEAEMSNDNNLEYLEPEAPPLDDLRQKFNQENQ